MLLEKLKENQYTDSQQQITSYLLSHLDKLSLLSINDLAKKTYTSNATIMRLCHKLGFSGYREFKYALLKELEANKYRREDVDYSIPFSTNESAEMIIKNMFSLYQESIQQVYQNIDPQTITNIAKMIVNKKRTFIYAYGDSQMTSLTFINKLAKLNIYPVLATQYHEELHITTQLNQDDFALIISYDGENPSLLDCIKILNEKGVKVALVSANEKSSLIYYSQYKIIIPHNEKANKISTFYSQFAFMYILNNIYALIYQMK